MAQEVKIQEEKENLDRMSIMLNYDKREEEIQRKDSARIQPDRKRRRRKKGK